MKIDTSNTSIADWIGLIIVSLSLLTLLFFLFKFLYLELSSLYLRIFRNNDSRLWISKWLKVKPIGKSYRELLEDFHLWLESMIDGKLFFKVGFGWKTQFEYFFRSTAFTRWLPFCFIYPIALIIIEWMVNGQSGFIHNMTEVSKEFRWVWAFSYFSIFWCSFFGFKYNNTGFIAVTGAVGVGSGIFLFADANFPGAGGTLIVGSSVFVVAFAGAFIGKGIRDGGRFFVYIVIGSIACASIDGSLLIQVSGAMVDFQTVHYFGVFLLILPYLNCFFDYLSWSVNRWLLRLMSNEENFWLTGIYGVLSFVFGVLCLLGLAFFLPLILKTFHSILGITGIDLRSYIELAKLDPFGKGLGITGMLCSILIPTLIIIVLTLITLFLPIIPWREDTIHRLSKKNTECTSSFGDIARVSGIVLIPIVIALGVVVTVSVNIPLIRDGFACFSDIIFSIALLGLELAE